MNRAQKFGLIVIAVSAATPFVMEYVMNRAELARLLAIEIQKDDEACRFADEAVTEMLLNNGYDGRLIDEIEDFEFHRIMYRAQH